MTLLPRISLSNNAWDNFKMITYVMIVLLSFQATVVAADSCESKQGNERFSEHHLQYNSIDASLVGANESALKQAFNQDDCLDCNATCCPCCSNSICTLLSVKDDIKNPELFFDNIGLIQLNTPYYSFLRPPKPYLYI